MIYFLITVGAVALLTGIWFIVTSNNLIAKRNRVSQCQSGICVALKQRNDMIPNLVASVKAYTEHENETLVRITELRARAESASDEQAQIAAGTELTRLLSRLQVSVERYPELKANQQYMMLQRSVEDMEDHLQAIRRTYNAAVVDYNNYIEMFPSSVVAGSRGHKLAALIDIPEAEKANVDVHELFNR